MKKLPEENRELEKEPLQVGAKILEMKGVKEETDRVVREDNIKRSLVWKKAMRKRFDEFIRAVNEPMPLKIKKTHSLGDFYGKFHPSKSTKGIKRSE